MIRHLKAAHHFGHEPFLLIPDLVLSGLLNGSPVVNVFLLYGCMSLLDLIIIVVKGREINEPASPLSFLPLPLQISKTSCEVCFVRRLQVFVTNVSFAVLSARHQASHQSHDETVSTGDSP